MASFLYRNLRGLAAVALHWPWPDLWRAKGREASARIMALANVPGRKMVNPKPPPVTASESGQTVLTAMHLDCWSPSWRAVAQFRLRACCLEEMRAIYEYLIGAWVARRRPRCRRRAGPHDGNEPLTRPNRPINKLHENQVRVWYTLFDVAGRDVVMLGAG